LFDKGIEAKGWQGYLKLVNTHGSDTDIDCSALRVFLLLLGHPNASFARQYTLQPHNHYCSMTSSQRSGGK
jgi:hypothetical protein